MNRNQLAAFCTVVLLVVTAAGCVQSNEELLVTDEPTGVVRFEDFVSTAAIKVGLAAVDKQGVIEELVAALIESGELNRDAQAEIIDAIMKREALGSTGIGRGVAVPHTAHANANRLIGTIGISAAGVDFSSLDGQKTHLFFLLISPPDQPGDQLRALETISRHFRDDAFCQSLRQCKTVADVQKVVNDADENSTDQKR